MSSFRGFVIFILYHDALHASMAHATTVLPVCPSLTLVISVKAAKHIIELFTTW